MLQRKILLAEDDPDDQVLFYEFLRHREDIHILPAVENGVDLLEFLDGISEHNELPQLIILDHNMPKKNGLQTLSLLKSNDRYQSIPVMVYSTYVDRQLEKSSLDLGASIVYGKPHTKQGYAEMIDAFLGTLTSSS
jgi:CheY-like chemotaxis protein